MIGKQPMQQTALSIASESDFCGFRKKGFGLRIRVNIEEKNVHSQTNGKWQLVRCFVMVVLGKRL